MALMTAGPATIVRALEMGDALRKAVGTGGVDIFKEDGYWLDKRGGEYFGVLIPTTRRPKKLFCIYVDAKEWKREDCGNNGAGDIPIPRAVSPERWIWAILAWRREYGDPLGIRPEEAQDLLKGVEAVSYDTAYHMRWYDGPMEFDLHQWSLDRLLLERMSSQTYDVRRAEMAQNALSLLEILEAADKRPRVLLREEQAYNDPYMEAVYEIILIHAGKGLAFVAGPGGVFDDKESIENENLLDKDTVYWVGRLCKQP